MTFDCMNIWRFPYYINKPSLVSNRFQLFKWSHFHIFSLSYNFTSSDLLTLICDLWPHQQMRVPMLHLWPNIGWNLSKHVEGRAKCWSIFTTDNSRLQKTTVDKVILLCIFPAKAGDTKSKQKSQIVVTPEDKTERGNLVILVKILLISDHHTPTPIFLTSPLAPPPQVIMLVPLLVTKTIPHFGFTASQYLLYRGRKSWLD